MKIFVPPLKWDRAIDGPDSKGYFQWLQDFERSQLPPGTVFPQPGQIWRTLRDCVVGVVAIMETRDSHSAKTWECSDGDIITLFASEGLFPPLPFGPARLVKGEKVRIVERIDATERSCSRPLRVNFRSLRHQELEKDFVSEKLRAKPEYQDYVLQIATARPRTCLRPEDAYLNEDFERVEDLA